MVRRKIGRIGVLMGGPSEEREISLKSGKAVYESLKNAGFEVVPIDIKSQDLNENIEKIKSYNIEVAFIALHGRFGEDGTVQKILEDLNIPYTGSGVLASRLALNKVLSRQRFLAFGLNVPDYIVLEKKNFVKDVSPLDRLKFPRVVKPACQGSSIGLSIVDDKDSLIKAIDLAFTFDEKIIIEEYIKGREVTVGIIDETPLPVIEIIPQKRFFDYEAKYTPGLTQYIVPAKIEEKIASQIKNSALVAHKSLGCFGFSRVDMILRDNKVYVLEVNTIPGLTETSLLPKAAKAVGIDFLELCLKLIDSAYHRLEFMSKIDDKK
jgi:D-alanine-D-alanine ligase